MSQTMLAIVSAIITGAFSLIGVYIANRKSQVLVEYRLEQIEQKQDRHNKMIERTYVLEGQMAEVQHDIRDLKERSKAS